MNISSLSQSTIKFSRKKYHYFLSNIDINSFLIKPDSKIKSENNILSLNPIKPVTPNSIPTKILKLLSNDISVQLSELINLSFFLGNFPSVIKSRKVSPIF